ncbi:MAG: NAD(+) diphosphatase [Pseudomonadota bacterium]
MKGAENVTFGGSGLDRRDGLRGDNARLAELLSDPSTLHMPVWRGKPLVQGELRDQLCMVPGSADVLAHSAEQPVFIGFDCAKAVFAHDVSTWEPVGQDTGSLGAFLDPSEQSFPGMEEDQRFSELRAVMTRLTPRDAELAATAKAILGWHRTHQFCARCGARSEIAKAGWQRTCATCASHHFPRTDPVVIMLVTHGNSVLVGRSPGWPDGMYSLLAGFVEPGETIEAAVRREVLEESGVRIGEVRYLSSQPWPFPASLMLGCHGFAESQEITVDPEEIEDALWVSRERMLAILAGEDTMIKAARKGAIARFLIERWLSDTLE